MEIVAVLLLSQSAHEDGVRIIAILFLYSAVGLVRRTAWGRLCAIAFFWIVALLSFVLVIPDREALRPGLIEGLLGRAPSSLEHYAAAQLAVCSWLVRVHILRRKRGASNHAAW